jgi:hypothetical protein
MRLDRLDPTCWLIHRTTIPPTQRRRVSTLRVQGRNASVVPGWRLGWAVLWISIGGNQWAHLKKVPCLVLLLTHPLRLILGTTSFDPWPCWSQNGWFLGDRWSQRPTETYQYISNIDKSYEVFEVLIIAINCSPDPRSPRREPARFHLEQVPFAAAGAMPGGEVITLSMSKGSILIW